MSSWGRTDDADRAVDRLLDAAGEVFSREGLTRATVSDVAREAGCSRQTVHRYFATGDDLRIAYVGREANEITGKVAPLIEHIVDLDDFIVIAVVATIDEVVARPPLRAWFSENAVGTTASVAAATAAVTDALGAFVDTVFQQAREHGRLRTDLDRGVAVAGVHRVLLSLWAHPPATREESERLVRALVVPLLLRDA